MSIGAQNIPRLLTVEDQQIEAVEPGDGNFERELSTGDLKLLDEIGCAGGRRENEGFRDVSK